MLQTELGQLCTDESIAMIYQPLHDVIQVQFMEGNDKRVLSGGWSWFGSNKKTMLMIVLTVMQGLISWISQRKDNLQKREFEHHSSW